MPVSDTTALAGPFTGNGITTSFPFEFKAMSASEVQVETTTGAVVAVVNPGAYTVTLSTDPDDPGGSVEFDTPPANGVIVTVYSEPSFLQEIDFEAQARFSPDQHNEANDRSAIRAIWLRDRVKRLLDFIDGGIPGDLRRDLAKAGVGFGVDLVAYSGDETLREAIIAAGDLTDKSVTPGSGDFSGKQDIENIPTGNGFTTFSTLNVQGETVQSAQREYLASFGMESTLGAAYTLDYHGDKCTVYIGMEAKVGSGDAWALNPVIIAHAGIGNVNIQGNETDCNNYNQHYGDTDGGGGLASPVFIGQSITGYSYYRGTAALLISGTLDAGHGGPGPIWNRGVVFGNNCLAQATIQDLCNAVVSYDLRGSHTYGVDTAQGSFSGGPFRLGNNSYIIARNAANTFNRNVIALNAGDNVVLGGTGVSGVVTTQHFIPSADNTLVCGNTGARWSAVWAANGTIQTSDPSLKEDIASVPSTLDIVLGVDPKTYRWKVGGQVAETVTEMAEVQAVETVETTAEVLREVNGVLASVQETVTEERPLWDDVPVLDGNGDPVLFVEKAPVFDDDGLPVMIEVEQPVRVGDRIEKQTKLVQKQEKRQVPMTRKVPRMEMREVEVQRLSERPGNRTHWGFLATDIQEAMATTGLDFGGYVEDENGTKHLRMDQLIPVLWKAVQELAAEVATLRGD